MNLRVTAKDRLLRVTWNQQNADLYRAKITMLDISDTGRQEQIQLHRSDLQSGAIVYQRTGEHVLITLVLGMPDASTISQSVAWESR